MREHDPFRRCATGLCRTQHDKVMTKDDTHFSVASGIRAAAFDARSLHFDLGEHASDLRDFMVQTRDIHEANSSLQDLGTSTSNKVSDEGATAFAQALQASFVVSANCSCERGRGTVGHQPTLCKLHDVFLCHARKVVGVKVYSV